MVRILVPRRTLAAASTLALALAACSGGAGAPDARLYAIDGGPPDAPACDLSTQGGCAPGDKCTFVVDTADPVVEGHVECVPAGSVADGDACTFSDGQTGHDDCIAGDLCTLGECQRVCDPGAAPDGCAPGQACHLYRVGYGLVGQCDRPCDPLDDNDFDGPGPLTKTGTACTAGEGCYGHFGLAGQPTFFACAPARTTTLFNRSVCDGPSGCLGPDGFPYVNGCAPGYVVVRVESSTSRRLVCSAMCRPTDCYQGHCGTGGADRIGGSPHTCSAADAAGTFNQDADGDHCEYSWSYEAGYTPSDPLLLSPTSNTVGFCWDHSAYVLPDPDGKPSTVPFPACADLPLTSTSTTCDSTDQSGCTAVDLGCVSTTTGGVPTALTRAAPRPRLPTGFRLPHDGPAGRP